MILLQGWQMSRMLLYENAMNGVLQKGMNSLGKSLLNKTEDCLLR